MAKLLNSDDLAEILAEQAALVRKDGCTERDFKRASILTKIIHEQSRLALLQISYAKARGELVPRIEAC